MNSILEQIYDFHVPTRLVFGRGAINRIPEELSKPSIRKPFLVTDAGIRKAGILDMILNVLADLPFSFHVFDQVEPNPKVAIIERGSALYKTEGCDALISLGGGSPIDAAKAIGVSVTNPGSISEYEGLGKVKNPIPYHMAIPTTYGTGSDVSFGAMITDPERNFKMSIGSPLLFPTVSIIDPDLALGLPYEVAASTGMDTLTHAIETYVSKKAQPLTEGISLQAVRLVSRNLRKAVKGDIECTANMMIASSMTGFCFSHTRCGAVHAMAHALGGRFDTPHGIANALLLPFVMEFNLEAAPEKYREIAICMGVNVTGLSLKDAARKSVDAVNDLIRDLSLPARLRDLGIDPKKFLELAADSIISGNIPANPRPVTEENILSIFEKAY
jgi:alcohol dehydrogenase class IV